MLTLDILVWGAAGGGWHMILWKCYSTSFASIMSIYLCSNDSYRSLIRVSSSSLRLSSCFFKIWSLWMVPINKMNITLVITDRFTMTITDKCDTCVTTHKAYGWLCVRFFLFVCSNELNLNHTLLSTNRWLGFRNHSSRIWESIVVFSLCVQLGV